LFNLFDRENGY